MGRPPLPLGTHGQIAVTRVGSGWEARCRYRDYDGATRLVRAAGATKAAAVRSLQERIRDRRGSSSLKSDARISSLAETYLAAVDESDRAPNTKARYR